MLNSLLNFPSQIRPSLLLDSTADIAILTRDNYAPSFVAAIDSAQHSIRMASFSVSTSHSKLVMDKFDVFSSLCSAADRGVSCWCAMASHKKSANTRFFNRKAAFKLSDSGWLIRWHPSSSLLHAKFLIIDDKLSFVGSHNISLSSSRSNIDVSLLIQSSDFAALLLSEFNKTWRECSSICN